ncbi:MAG: site-specific DNA-methyltransferase [Christensenellaceae bacterium]|jgi:adenine-specific DNA-methyltransferase
MNKPEKLSMRTPSLADENFATLVRLFPNAVTETIDENGAVVRAIDADVLAQEINTHVVSGREERYQFTWPDKRKSILLANAPIGATLRPCREESVDSDNTENLYIEGDNLDVLKLLRETYLNKVKMIYIDPPYNTGNDFVYEDDYSEETGEFQYRDRQLDENGNRLVKNIDSNGRFHTDWLNMIYPRLCVARGLLKDDGVIFISIDDNELKNILRIVSDIFGEGNIMACFPRVTKKAGKTTESIAKNNDYVVMCSKGPSPKITLPLHTDEGFKYSDEFEVERGKYKLNQTLDYDSLQYSASLDYPIEIEGKTLYPGNSYEKYLERKKGNHARADWAWRWSKDLFEFGLAKGFIVVKNYDGYSRIYTKTYQNATIKKTGKTFTIEYTPRTRAISSLEFIANEYSNDNSKKNLLSIFETNVFDYSKPVSLLKALIKMSTDESDIILDFFSGSATTAHAVMQLNAEDGGKRKFIMVQLAEPCDENSEAYKAGYKNISEIGKERIRRAGKKIKEDNRYSP